MTSLRYFDNLRYGSFDELEVLIDPSDNSLWIASTSVAKMLDWDPKRVSRRLNSKTLKDFAGKGLAGTRQVSGKDTLGRPNKVTAIH